ncbi:hypothetical protein BCR39DRAFT_554400 [Naematelia encephala]|uniref:PWI domain-containing protein n=1 Tax=Naematelia encephala TaxID=71784 RepID=A0A1Y2AFG4_9TREE|nr:hypothetical protein BCR39DRAFT_554400 [Naematelia encephala]
MPTPPHGTGGTPTPSGPPGFVRDVRTTKVFVGSIAPGISDQTIRDLLNACGPLHELKRVTGANGNPQSFGFALFESPEVVMRCIRCLNGVELPDMTVDERSRGKTTKALVVKVDEKTREFLDEFEQTLGRSEDDESADAVCRKAISHIVALLTDPNAIEPDTGVAGPAPRIPVIVPAHLQDLREGDLPENQRVAVLDQIAVFRENAAKREREKKSIDLDRERFKVQQAASAPPGSRSAYDTQSYGYGTRAFNQQQPNRSSAPSQSPHQNGSQRDGTRDPQSYNKPVNFTPAQNSASKAESDRTDEEEEELRKQRRARELESALRDRERRVENRERQRIEALRREMAHRKQQSDAENRNRVRLQELLETWDDDEKIDRGKELFYSDRIRWRNQRQHARTREYQEDVRDRQLEADEAKALEQESEAFLQKQLEDMASMDNKQRRAGLLTEDAAPIKLAIAAPVVDVKPEEKPATIVARPGVSFDGDEEDDTISKKKRRFVRLEDDGDLKDMTEAEKLAKRNARLLEIKTQIPPDRRELFSTSIEWAALNEALIQNKLRSFVSKQIAHFLGDVDEDLVAFALEHVGDHKGPRALIEGLEPVLDDEAEAFTANLWRELVFESLAYKAGLETGSMTA